MKDFLRFSTVCVILLHAAAVAASDDEWDCSRDGLTRNVLVIYPNEPAPLPCKVYYAKPNENVLPRVLWQARNVEGFCADKAAEFVVKLESWGWQCAIKSPE